MPNAKEINVIIYTNTNNYENNDAPTPPCNPEIAYERLDSLARALLPLIQDYLSSEQGQADYEEWSTLNFTKKNNKFLES